MEEPEILEEKVRKVTDRNGTQSINLTQSFRFALQYLNSHSVKLTTIKGKKLSDTYIVINIVKDDEEVKNPK